MLRTLWTGRAGLYANQNRMDAISNNIANVSTDGYKQVDTAFQDMFNDKLNRMGLPVTAKDKESLTSGIGSRADVLVENSSQGTLMQTGNQGDLAIDGNGYFRVLNGKDTYGNNKYLYTRDGSFSLDNAGNLVNGSGYILDVEGRTPPQNIKGPFSIDQNGNINSNGAIVGRIKLHDFSNKDGMVSVGGNLFEASPGAREISDTGNSVIRQGFLEQSNVDMGQQLTDMIITQRAYQLNSKSIQSADEMWQIANNLRNK